MRANQLRALPIIVGRRPTPRVRSERDGGGVALSPASCSTYVAAWPPPGAGKLVLARLPLRVEPVRDVHGPGIWDDVDLQPRRQGDQERAPLLPGSTRPRPRSTRRLPRGTSGSSCGTMSPTRSRCTWCTRDRRSFTEFAASRLRKSLAADSAKLSAPKTCAKKKK